MSNVEYTSSLAGFKDGSICWTTGVFRAQLWRNASYVATHQNVQQVIDAGGILVASSDVLTTSVTAAGAADGDDASFPSIAEGPVITMMTIAQTSGPQGGEELPAAQQRLVLFLNRGQVAGAAGTAPGSLAFTPAGRPVVVRWSDTASRIFI